MPVGGDDDNARAARSTSRRLLQLRPQQCGQRKVAQVVDAEMALEAVGREGSLGDRHDARIQHENVNRPIAPALLERLHGA